MPCRCCHQGNWSLTNLRPMVVCFVSILIVVTRFQMEKLGYSRNFYLAHDWRLRTHHLSWTVGFDAHGELAQRHLYNELKEMKRKEAFSVMSRSSEKIDYLSSGN